MHEKQLQETRRRLRARRHRDGKLRLRAVVLSLALFALFWALVFAQMVSGHDPVLSAKAAAGTGSSTNGSSPRPGQQKTQRQQRAQQTQLALDPETGAIVQVPAAPAPAPVTTSQS